MKFARLACIPMIAGALAMAACTADVEDEGELPEVNAEGGEMPSVDVDPANVDVTTGTDTSTVVVPQADVDVNAPDNQ